MDPINDQTETTAIESLKHDYAVAARAVHAENRTAVQEFLAAARLKKIEALKESIQP